MGRLIPRYNISLEHRVLGALLIVDFFDNLILLRFLRNGVNDLTAFVLSLWQPRDNIHRRFAVEGRIDAVVGERRQQGDRPAGIASRGGKCRPIARHHCWCWHKPDVASAGGTSYCAMVAPEEEELVLQNRSAQCSAKLIALQIISL